METTLKTLRIVWTALTAAILIYAYLSFHARVKAIPTPATLKGIGLLAISEILLLFFFRARMLRGAIDVLRTAPEDVPALARWRQASIVSWGLSLAIALYGLVLRYLGFEFRQVLPFFVTGLFLMFLFAPRRPS